MRALVLPLSLSLAVPLSLSFVAFDGERRASARSEALPADRIVDVVGAEFGFKLPPQLPPGRVAFRFRNIGKVPHEMNAVLLKPGFTVAQYMDAANAGKPVSPFIDRTVGVLFAGPGETTSSMLVTDLEPGRLYAFRCIFKDKQKGRRHEAMGMYATLQVNSVKVDAANADTPPPIVADTIVGAEYGYKYPHTLAPGVHHFAFVNVGTQRHEVSVELLNPGVTLKQYIDLDKAHGDVETLIDRSLGLMHTMGGTAPAGLLRIDLLPGREYVIECTFSDTDTSPTHNTLGMVGSIHVAAVRKPRASP